MTLDRMHGYRTLAIRSFRGTAAAMVMVLSLAALPAAAQSQLWLQQLGSSGWDEAGAAAPDGSGGMYVCGMTEGSFGGPNAGNGDAWLARYDAAGNQLWIRQFGTSFHDWASAVLPDGSGGVYVGGGTDGSLGAPQAGNGDAWLARYDSTGNQLWIRQLGTSAYEGGVGFAAPDGSGGVYVGGTTEGSLGGPNAGNGDAWLARYDAAGNQLWIRQFGTSDYERANAAAPDASGGVYVGGDTTGSLGGPNAGAIDAWLARYDSAGNQLWILQLGTSGWDGAEAAAPDGSGGVYVSGGTFGCLGGPNAGNEDTWIARYDSTGNQLWIRQFGTSSGDRANDAAPDGSGGVYLGGRTGGSLGGPNGGDVDTWIARYDSTGNQLWIRQFGTNASDYPTAAAPDGSGGFYVGGITYGSLGAPNAGGPDAWLARYGGLAFTRYCTQAIPNSTLQAGRLNATGSNSVAANEVTLEVIHLPQSSFGFLLTSRDRGDTYPVNNSQGRLCLGGFIGRYVGPGQIKNSGTSGSFSLAIDLTSMPQPLGYVAAQPGDTWNFQAWYRDANPTSTSNFTDAVSVTFQ